MVIWTTAGLTRLATLMNARESSAGEASGACLGAFGSSSAGAVWLETVETLGAVWPETIGSSGACWPKAIQPLDANKLNPSIRASAGVNIRPRFALFIEALNLFSIFSVYLCVDEMKGRDRSGLQTAPQTVSRFTKNNSLC